MLVLLAMPLPGCRKVEQPPARGLTLQQIADVYAEAVLIRSVTDSLQAMARIDSMMRSRGITRDQIEATVEAFRKDPSKWLLFLSLVEKKLENATSVKVVGGKARKDTTARRSVNPFAK
ncbi:MAG: hypothetical protein Q9P14_00525 [candidate division KSB1 bacterium]|nr:hypothetical protein [candidate division KSB1 bacterium]